MNKKLERKVGRIVIAVFWNVINIYLTIFVILAVVLTIVLLPALAIAIISIILEKISGINTSQFIASLFIPFKGTLWGLEKISNLLFYWSPEGYRFTSTGLFVFIATVIVIIYIEYKKKMEDE
ncbi:MAG: hypothetical protein DCF20_16195 [Pseudanabaena sp.]|nr:MAG: hypothetical protein DCF20_16195 [Pseudanabaena sp.]